MTALKPNEPRTGFWSIPQRVGWPVLALIGGVGVAAVVGGLLVVADGGVIRYDNVPIIEKALPASRPSAVVQPAIMPAAVDPALPIGDIDRTSDPAAPPVAIDPQLVTADTSARLPVRSSDGRRPLDAYARAFDDSGTQPRVALIVGPLGLDQAMSAAALALHPSIDLVISPYADDVDGWLTRTRTAGHEAWLGLPMQSEDPARFDPGPLAVMADEPADEVRARLERVLATGAGYVGVLGPGGRVGLSVAARNTVLEALGQRGLAFVEVDAETMAQAARELSAAYGRTVVAIDVEPSALAIDYALAALETHALETGAAIGMAGVYPISLRRISVWADTLESKGLVLAPVSAVIDDPQREDSASG